MNKEHKTEMYPYAYVYRGTRTILIWQTNDCDTFKLNSDDSLLQTSTLSTLKKKMGPAAIKVHWTEYAEINFDKFFTALKNLRTERSSASKTCFILLEGWNFIEDMIFTFDLRNELKKLRSRVLNKAHDKLFYGCNLPSVTPEGKSYNPIWTKEEVAAMRSALRAVWTTFRRKGYIQP